ncbi:MAG: hypothetical protein WKG07_22365 [Hymenobacter sp.]
MAIGKAAGPPAGVGLGLAALLAAVGFGAARQPVAAPGAVLPAHFPAPVYTLASESAR